MLLLNWTPFVFSRKGFLRDEEGKPYVPSSVIENALKSAAVYYYIKKDKEIENKVKNYLLKKELDPKEVVEKVRELVFNKYPIFENLKIQEKIYLNPERIKEEYIEVFDLKEWIDVKGFKTEIYQDTLEIDIHIDNWEKVKAIAHSYAEGLAHMEMTMLKDHPLVDIFYKPLLTEMKNWEAPLRIGMWTENKFKGNLLFFWRIKEVREKFLKEHKLDIRPRYVLYLPREKQTTGWAELKKEGGAE